MSYTVARGDTLSSIASKLGVSLKALEQANPQIKNFNLVMPGQALNTPGGGGTAAPAAPALDMNAALNQYGILAQIVNSIPDLRKALQDSAAAGDSPDAFNAKIAATPWYQQHSDSLRNLLFQQAADPATYQSNFNNAADLVSQTAAQMGRSVDVNALTYQYLSQGWTAADLKAHIGLGAGIGNATDGYQGEVAQYEALLKQTAESYGVPYTQGLIDDYVNKIQTGRDTADGFDNLMKARAKAMYPHFANQIDQGMTMSTVADPYAAQMAKTLELPQTSVNWQTDPLIQKALSAKDPTTGAPTSQPMWQFTQSLRADPRYAVTEQAHNDAVSLIHTIGQSFGFMS